MSEPFPGNKVMTLEERDTVLQQVLYTQCVSNERLQRIEDKLDQLLRRPACGPAGVGVAVAPRAPGLLERLAAALIPPRLAAER